MVEIESLQLPAILKVAADRLLDDVGLTSDGNRVNDNDGLTIGLHNKAKLMAHDQAVNLRSANRELLKRIQNAINLNYPDNENYRRVYTIGSMAIIRACRNG